MIGEKITGCELSSRINGLKRLLKSHNIDLALIRQNADLYYFSGTVQDSHLLIPVDCDPILLVWRVYERALLESSLDKKYHLPSFSKLPDFLRRFSLDKALTIGLELDTMPAKHFFIYKKLWPKAKFLDISELIRQLRAVKSKWEINQIKASCVQIKEVIDKVPSVIKEGISELELHSFICGELQKKGHPGFFRMRAWNQELLFGQVLAGSSGNVASWTLTPAGGVGLGPAYGVSASRRRISKGEPILVDFGGWVNGYLCDQSRMFVLGKASDKIKYYFNWIVELHKKIELLLKPGTLCGQLYDFSFKEAEKIGVEKYFMGPLGNQVRFIGHGLGIELDEYPFISKGNKMILKESMVVAIEPKVCIPDIGLIGIEDTYLITEKGAERLTLSPQELIEV